MRRVWGLVAVAVAGVLLIGGCSSQTGGHPSARQAAAASDAMPDATPVEDHDLAARLEPAPPGSQPWAGTWAATTFPTVQDYLEALWPDQSYGLAAADLAFQGMVSMAHHTWTMPDRQAIDIILMRFEAPAGAEDRFLSLKSALDVSGAPLHLKLTSVPAAHVLNFVSDQRGPGRMVLVRTIAYSGDIVMESYFYCRERVQRDTLTRWVNGQLERLG